MELLVNDEISPIRVDAHQTLREVAQAVCPVGTSDPHLVVSVHCDGQAVPMDQLETVLDGPAGRFREVAFQTQPMRALVMQSVVQAIELFRSVNAARLQAADLIAQGQQQEALQTLQQFMRDWRQVQEIVPLASEALDVPLDTLEADGQTMPDLLAELKTQLTEMKSALESGDLVLVGDILRFELETPFARWTAALEALRSRAR